MRQGLTIYDVGLSTGSVLLLPPCHYSPVMIKIKCLAILKAQPGYKVLLPTAGCSKILLEHPAEFCVSLVWF